MRYTALLLVIISNYGYCQYDEFKTHSNGLIYDESTMNRLGTIVDSLNVRFRSCDLSHPYYSLPQGFASLVKIPNAGARRLIASGASFDEYAKAYPGSISMRDVWIIKIAYIDYKGSRRIEYSGLPGSKSDYSIDVKSNRANNKVSGWVIDEDGKAAFFLSSLTTSELPHEYARLVQYVDCMIDTTASIFFPQAEGKVYQSVEPGSKASEFIELAERFPNKPDLPDYKKFKQDEILDSAISQYLDRKKEWDSLRMINVDKQMNLSTYWRELLAEAVDEGVATGNSDARLEFYAKRYLSKSDALRLMRSRIVIGNCSMDQSPRYHAMNICQLAAETTQWDIFLRSHLDIMNDNFERMSDGSYAWARRKTYLKELEDLDIDAANLLLGTCLRVNNVSDNHYYGSIGRIGRALADAADKDTLEAKLFKMVQDQKLDPFNRLLMAYLLSNYAYHLDDTSRGTDLVQKLEVAMASAPAHIIDVWKQRN